MGLKDIREQVIVVTGASGGIGRATARLAAARGAAVVLAARGRERLTQTVKEIRARGGEAVPVVADVSALDQVREVACQAVGRFGRIDTWVNHAAVSIQGSCDEVSLDDARYLFDINYWGVVHGCQVAAAAMRGRGGAIINVGGPPSETAMPLQAHDNASQHAVKGFTDGLRRELERAGVPIVVTLVKPWGLARAEQAGSETAPSRASPRAAPSVVAEAILDAAVRPQREVAVRPGGRTLGVRSGVRRAFTA